MTSSLDKYAQNQRSQYNATSKTRESAENQVAPNYSKLRANAKNYVNLMLGEYALRRGLPEIKSLKWLDFGCGVGRVMEAISELGGSVDGADLSEEMIKHAEKSPLLTKSRFYRTSGYDIGGAPQEEYDIAYSFLCIHHIPMRITRLKIFEGLMRCLKDGGMCFIELNLFPGVTASKIPHNHASWSDNKIAKFTNSRSDVWVTPDNIGLVFQDMMLFYSDVFILEAETGAEHHEYNADAIYQYSFNPLFVGGFKGAALHRKLSR